MKIYDFHLHAQNKPTDPKELLTRLLGAGVYGANVKTSLARSVYAAVLEGKVFYEVFGFIKK